jgi:hypothetical protein
MSYLDRIFENASESVTIPNPLTFTGAVSFNNSVTVGTGKNLSVTKGLFTVGAFSSTTKGSGVALSSSVTSVARVYADDNGAAMTGNLRTFLARTLLTVDHAGDLSVRSVMGHLKMVNGVDLTNGYCGGVEGYLEMAGTNNVGATSHLAAVQAIVELTTASTVTSGGVLAGVNACWKSDATASGNSVGVNIEKHPNNSGAWVTGLNIGASSCATGIKIGTGCTTALDIDSGSIDMSTAGTGSYSIVLKDAVADALSIIRGSTDMVVFNTSTPTVTLSTGVTLAVTKGNLTVGAFHSTDQGSGVVISASNTAAFRVYGDDGGAKLAAGEKRVSISRFLYATSDTDATDQTMSAHVGQVKVGNDLTIGGNLAGLCGYLEVLAAKTLIGGRYAQASVASAVWGRVDVPATGVIGTAAYVSAFAASGNLGGTHTGKASVIHVPNPGAGTWDLFASFGATTGCTVANALVPATAPDASTMGADLAIKIDLNGTAYYIPAYDTLHG